MNLEWSINDEYLPLLENHSRFEILFGGAGSGKSRFIAQKKSLEHLQYDTRKTLVVRKIKDTLKESCFAEIKAAITEGGLSDYFKTTISPLSVKCLVNGNEFIFLGLDDADKLKSISGITDIWVEEATETEESDLNQLDLRLRGSNLKDAQICLSFNPINSKHWLRNRFRLLKKDLKIGEIIKQGNVTVLRTDYTCNRFLGEEYINVLENYKDIDSDMHTVYALGLWGGLSDPDQLIRDAWVNNMTNISHEPGKQRLGVDCARYGDDKSKVYKWNGNQYQKRWTFDQFNTTEQANFVGNLIAEDEIDADQVGIDTVGLGAGVADQLVAKGYHITEVVSGAKPIEGVGDTTFSFKNLRSQMWWMMREALKAGHISATEVPQELLEDLTAPKYKIKGDKQIEVESKDDIKKRLGRSTDDGDAFIYGWFVQYLAQGSFMSVA